MAFKFLELLFGENMAPPKIILVIGCFMILNIYLHRLFSSFKISINRDFTLLILSMIIGVCIKYAAPTFLVSLATWNPRSFLDYMHPLMILKISYDLDVHLFKRMLIQIIMLSTVGVIAFGLLMAEVLNLSMKGHAFLSYYAYSFALSAAECMHVSEDLRDVDSMKYMLVLMQSESIVSVAICILIMDILMGAMEGVVTTALQYTLICVRYIGVSIIFGFVMGKFTSLILTCFFNEVSNTILGILAIVYQTYYMCDNVLYCSAPLATFIVCLYVASERARLPSDIDNIMLIIWNILLTISEYVLFALVSSSLFAFSIDQYLKYHVCEFIAIYISGEMLRAVTLLIIYPILIRVGPRLDIRTVLGCFWLSKKGYLQLTIVDIAGHMRDSHKLVQESIGLAYFYFVLHILINDVSSSFFLQIFGFTKVSKQKRSNLRSCLKFIENKKMQFRNTLKMNRFLADCDWNIIDNYTQIIESLNLDDADDHFDYHIRPRKSICTECRKEIILEPTKKELVLMNMEAKMRVLLAQKVSFVRQHEKGMVTKDSIRNLLVYLDIVMDSKDKIFKLDVLKYQVKMSFYNKMEYYALDYSSREKLKKPRKFWRRPFYALIKHKFYEVLIYLVTLTGFMRYFYYNSTCDYNFEQYLFITFYSVDFCVKIVGMAHVYMTRAVTQYFNNYWNKFDFVLLMLNFISAIALSLRLERPDDYKYDFPYFALCSLEVAKILRLLKFIELLCIFHEELLRLCETRIRSHLASAYDIADAVIVSYDEVLHKLPDLIDNENIRKEIRERMLVDRSVLLKQIENIDKTMPWVAASVKTKRVLRSTLVVMNDYINLMKTEGLIDDFEYKKIMEAHENRVKSMVYMKYEPLRKQEDIMSELTWVDNYDELTYFLSANSIFVSFERNESVVSDGYDVKGIYVLTSGFVRMIYKPYTMTDYAKACGLPIKENILDDSFHEPKEEYLIPGNTVGELAILTGRENQCEIYCESPVTAYFIPRNIVQRTLYYKTTNPQGVTFTALWLNQIIFLVASILWEVPVYRSFSLDQLYLHLMKGFVPKLDGHSAFIGSEYIEDIVLVEGVVKDLNTHDTYKGPCYLPRSCQKLIIHMDEKIKVVPILFVLPLKDSRPHELYSTILKGNDLDKYTAIIGKTKPRKIRISDVSSDAEGIKKHMKLKSILRSPTLDEERLPENMNVSDTAIDKKKDESVDSNSSQSNSHTSTTIAAPERVMLQVKRTYGHSTFIKKTNEILKSISHTSKRGGLGLGLTTATHHKGKKDSKKYHS